MSTNSSTSLPQSLQTIVTTHVYNLNSALRANTDATTDQKLSAFDFAKNQLDLAKAKFTDFPVASAKPTETVSKPNAQSIVAMNKEDLASFVISQDVNIGKLIFAIAKLTKPEVDDDNLKAFKKLWEAWDHSTKFAIATGIKHASRNMHADVLDLAQLETSAVTV